ncbi:MAG: hypothetical protein WDM88_12335 [Galbitalea sp.]
MAVFAILLGLVALSTVLGWSGRTALAACARSTATSCASRRSRSTAGRPCCSSRRRSAPRAFPPVACSDRSRRAPRASTTSTLDLTHRPDIAAQFNVLQTPTTLILDRSGVIRARIGGAPRQADVRAALDTILAA